MKNIKAVIPVAGMGSNLRPHTHTQPKALVPVAGKPILAHIIDSLIEVKISEFVLIIGYLGDKIEKYVSQHYPNIKVNYVIQEPRLGLGQAIALTKNNFDDGADMLIILGDTIVNADLQAFIDTPNSVLGVKKVDNPGSVWCSRSRYTRNNKKTGGKALYTQIKPRACGDL